MKNIVLTTATLVGFVSAAVAQDAVVPKAPAIPPRQPGVNVRVGQKFSVVTETKNSSATEAAGQVLENEATTIGTVIYEVMAAEPDSITLRATISSLRVAGKAMGQELTFDSARNDNLSPLAGDLERDLRTVRTVTISRSGQIKNEDDPWSMSSSRLLGTITAGRIVLFEPELTFADLKTGTVVPSFVSGATTSKGSYTVGSMSGGTVNVSYAGNGAFTDVTEQMGMELKVQNSWTERSELQIDAASRVVLSKEMTREAAIIGNVNGMDIPGKGKVTISQKVTPLN